MDLSRRINTLNAFKTIDANYITLDWGDLGTLGSPIASNQCDLTNSCQLTVNTDFSSANLQCCNFNDFNYNFKDNENILVADRNKRGETIRFPIRLSFNPPVRAVATQISVDAPQAGTGYFGQIQLHLGTSITDDYWQTKKEGTLNSTRDTAPFLGAVAARNKAIYEVWIDAFNSDQNSPSTIFMVAINSLLVIP
jgi:hypothetical protein